MATVQQQQTENPLVSLLIDITGAFISSSISKTGSAPLENIKIILQTQADHPNNRHYKGLFDTFTGLVKEDGWKSLFRGNVSAVLRYIPTTLLSMVLRAQLQSAFRGGRNEGYWQMFLRNVSSGGVAGLLTLLVVYPFDYTRTRLAADVGPNHQFNGHLDCVSKTMAVDGISGLYAGFIPSVAGIFAYRALYFGLYDGIGPLVRSQGLLAKYIAAQSITIAAGLGTYPIDTIRRRLMIQQGGKQKKYNGAIDCTIKIVRDEGVPALFAGASINIIRTMMASVFLVAYDMITS